MITSSKYILNSGFSLHYRSTPLIPFPIWKHFGYVSVFWGKNYIWCQNTNLLFCLHLPSNKPPPNPTPHPTPSPLPKNIDWEAYLFALILTNMTQPMATETTANAVLQISTQSVKDSFWKKFSDVLFGETVCDETVILKIFIVVFIPTENI